MYLWHQLKPGQAVRPPEEVLEEAVRTLKGYFVWESHVVTATKAEIRLMRGHRAVRSDSLDRVWSPMKLLDGSPMWQDEPHVVVLGDDENADSGTCLFPTSKPSFSGRSTAEDY